MADAAAKATIFFEAVGGTSPTGWTETFWSSNGNLSSLLSDVVQKYVPVRKELLGIGAVIQFVRVSNIPPNRISKIYYLGPKQGEGSIFTNSPADDHDPTQVDLLFRLETAGGKRRQMWLSGLPDSVTDQLVLQGVTGPFVNSAAVKQWAAAITGIPFALRYKSGQGTPRSYTADAITSVTPIMVRNRKRGRPFDLFRGRRLA